MLLQSDNIITTEFGNFLVTLAALVLSVFALLKTQKKERLELSNILAGIRRSQYEDIHQWGIEVIETMAQTSSLCENDPAKKIDFFDSRVTLIGKLSYLLDRGKLYLPNDHPDKIGVGKPGAYQGLKKEVLEELTTFHDLALGLNFREKEPNKLLQRQLVDTRKKFVSELQKTLEVRKIESELTKMVEELKKVLNDRD